MGQESFIKKSGSQRKLLKKIKDRRNKRAAVSNRKTRSTKSKALKECSEAHREILEMTRKCMWLDW